MASGCLSSTGDSMKIKNHLKRTLLESSNLFEEISFSNKRQLNGKYLQFCPANDRCRLSTVHDEKMLWLLMTDEDYENGKKNGTKIIYNKFGIAEFVVFYNKETYGNRKLRFYENGVVREITVSPEKSFSYDSNGKLISETTSISYNSSNYK